MNNTTKDPFGIESMTKTWTKTMNDVMGNMSQAWSTAARPAPSPKPDSGITSTATMDAVTSAFKNWQTVASALTTPESMAAFLKGAGTLPEIGRQFGQAVIGSLTELQKKMAESASRLGQSVEGYSFENLDETILNVWTDIYEKEFQKFFQIPQLGLTREYQERFNLMIDKWHLFQADYAELLRLLSLPFQRSMGMMQEKIADMAESGEMPEDGQVYYQMWIKTLEGHFMTLFQTPEYIQALTKTVTSLSQFSNAKDAVLEDMLQSLPIARKTEIDELAREVYELKKRIRKLEKANLESRREP